MQIVGRFLSTDGVTPNAHCNRAGTLEDIRAQYPFWTVEYVYGSGEPAVGPLATAFGNYLTSPEGTRTIARFEHFACGPEDLADLGASGR